MKRAVAWALAATCAVVLACNREPGDTARPDGDPSQASVQARFPDLAALYGGEHGIYRSCGPNQGVCHNNAEYPDLSTLGSVTMIVGADCNRGREDPTEHHDLCEGRGDFLAFGETTRIEIGEVIEPYTEYDRLFRERFGDLNAFDQDAASLEALRTFEASFGVDFFGASVVRTRKPVRARVGAQVSLVRLGEDGEETLARYEVRRRHPRHPRGDDLIALRPVRDKSSDDNIYGDYGYGGTYGYGLAGLARVGDPNRNGVFGAGLSGGLVVPGHPERSYLMRRLVDPAAGPLMPRANCCTWTKQSLRALHCWIAGLSPDGSNALEPIDYEHCPPGPEEDVAYPQPGPSCTTSGMCPVMPRVEVEGAADWDSVYGLLNSRCGGAQCHGTSAYGLDLSTAAAAKETMAAYVVDGAPARSELYLRITPHLARAAALEIMPKKAEPLPLAERELVRAWISQLGNADAAK